VISYLVFLTAKALDVTPCYFVHCIFHIVSSPESTSSRHGRVRTSIAQIRCGLIILAPNLLVPMLDNFQGVSLVKAFPRSNALNGLTCLAANLSTCTPQPCLKQFASSKIARTSSPFAAPPFFIPAFSASSSIDAAFEAAADKYVTASAGFGVQPQPCLMDETVSESLQ